jgi:hypothetical protein
MIFVISCSSSAWIGTVCIQCRKSFFLTQLCPRDARNCTLQVTHSVRNSHQLRHLQTMHYRFGGHQCLELFWFFNVCLGWTLVGCENTLEGVKASLWNTRDLEAGLSLHIIMQCTNCKTNNRVFGKPIACQLLKILPAFYRNRVHYYAHKNQLRNLFWIKWVKPMFLICVLFI